MSHSKNSKKNTNTPANDIAAAEDFRTELAAAKQTTQAVDVMVPEKFVVDAPPPQPDYPRYRVRLGEPIVLANLDPDASEHYKKKKHVEEELEYQRQRLGILQERLYAEHKTLRQ